MITRVTDNIKFNMLTNNLFNVAGKYGELMEKISTGKNINRPSDDPIGTNDILDFRTIATSIEQYQTNITDADIWLNLTSTNISGLRKIADQAKSIAISESGASGSAETRQASAAALTALIDEALSLLNAKNGDNYLFGGSSTDLQPFSTNYASASVGVTYAATTNSFNGTVISDGTYTGVENKNYVLKIVAGGTLATATYQISSDGGKSWGATQDLPAQVVKGSTANASGGTPITAATVWNTIDGANVQNGTTIDISGFDHDGNAVGPDTYTIADATTGTVQDLLDQIELSYGGTATASIDTAGRITVTDDTTGVSQMEMTLSTTNPPGGSLDFGMVSISATKSISLGNGVTMTFAAGSRNYAANDIFTVNANAAGYYRGNDDKLNAVIGHNNNMAYNITGTEAFTGQFASASVINAGAGIAADDLITLTRGTTIGSWTVTSQANYPNMIITSQTAESLTIDADNDGTDDIRLNLTGSWEENNTVTFSTTAGIASGEIPVTFSGSGSVDLLSTLNALMTGLQETDQARAQKLIVAQVENLANTETQMLQYETQAGAKMNSLETTSSNHKAIDLQVTNMLADIETADLTQLIMEFQMKQIAMQASYSMASQIGKMTIMDYIS